MDKLLKTTSVFFKKELIPFFKNIVLPMILENKYIIIGVIIFFVGLKLWAKRYKKSMDMVFAVLFLILIVLAVIYGFVRYQRYIDNYDPLNSFNKVQYEHVKTV